MALSIVTKTSTPSFYDFNPKYIPWQYRLVYDVENTFNYKEGSQYVMLSGSVGSAKSIMLAFLIIRHCIKYPGARVCIGRKALPDIKDTIFKKVKEMLYDSFVEKTDFFPRDESAYIRFKNGSEVISRSWHDRKFKKFRSLELSMLVFEELTENDKRDWEFWDEAIARVERLPHVPEHLVIAATNPDDPGHPAYKFFIQGSKKKNEYYATKKDDDGVENIHVYYSLTEQNPFLSKSYIRNLRKRYDAKMVQRMLMGQWIYISTDVIYYSYDPEAHEVEGLEINKRLPLRFTFDFNIAKGKLMSSCMFQFSRKARNDTPLTRRFRFFDEVGVEGARTEDALEEWAGKGWFDLPHNPDIIIHGDATGKSGSSKSKLSDYEIIEKFLANYRRKDGQHLNYEIDVPANGQNPPLRDRHNIANGQLRNADKEIAVAIHPRCELVKEGFLNTKLKENSGYIEDQTTAGQDMSTVATYGIHWCIEYELEETETGVKFL